MMVLFTVFSIAAIIGMLLYASCKHGELPECLSDCYYIIGLPFTFVFFFASWAMIVPAMECWASGVTVGMILFLSLVGVASDYKDADYHYEHVVGAVVAAVLSVIFVVHACPPALLCYAIALAGVVDRKRWLLYAELSCFASVWVGVTVH